MQAIARTDHTTCKSIWFRVQTRISNALLQWDDYDKPVDEDNLEGDENLDSTAEKEVFEDD